MVGAWRDGSRGPSRHCSVATPDSGRWTSCPAPRINKGESVVYVRKTLLVSGIVSSLLYVAMNIFVAMQWEGYSSASQTVSELSAIGAPTRRSGFRSELSTACW